MRKAGTGFPKGHAQTKWVERTTIRGKVIGSRANLRASVAHRLRFAP